MQTTSQLGNCVFAIVLLTPLVGCVGPTTTGSVYEDSPPLPGISMKEYSLEIVDERTGVEDRPISVPALSFPGQQDEISPPLPDSLHDLAIGVLTKIQRPGEQTLEFRITVIQASQTFEARALSEVEGVNWAVKVNVSAPDQRSWSVSGRASGRRESQDASRDYLSQMFVLGFEKALEDALSHVPDDVGTLQ